MKTAYFGIDALADCLEVLLQGGHEVIKIFTTEGDAYEIGRTLARSDGVFCGISAGAAAWAAVRLAQRQENEGKRIAVIIPDTGARYLSVENYFE